MNGKLWRLAVGLLPICFLSAQQPDTQEVPPQVNREGFRQPSPEAMRRIAEQRQTMRAHANAINDLAGHIQSLDDARKLVDLVAADFSHELPPKWATPSSATALPAQSSNLPTIPGFSSLNSVLLMPGTITSRKLARLRTTTSLRLKSIPSATATTLVAAFLGARQPEHLDGSQHLRHRPGWQRANGCRALEVLNILGTH